MLTSKHGRKARAVHETCRQAAPHARDALRGIRLAYDVNRTRVLLRDVFRLHKLQLELALDRLCGVGHRSAGV